MNAKDAKHNLQFLRQMENTSNFSILDYLNCHIVHCVSAIIDSWIVNVVFGYCILLRTSRFISFQISVMSSKDSVTLLCTSIKEGNVSEVRRALASGVDPNSPSSDWGQTRPLILAASSGHPEILEALLAHPDLDPNLPDGMFGNTALIEASHTGHTDVVELLIKDKR